MAILQLHCCRRHRHCWCCSQTAAPASAMSLLDHFLPPLARSPAVETSSLLSLACHHHDASSPHSLLAFPAPPHSQVASPSPPLSQVTSPSHLDSQVSAPSAADWRVPLVAATIATLGALPSSSVLQEAASVVALAVVAVDEQAFVSAPC